MPVDVQVPKLGLTMREGTVGKWVAADGARVSTGDVLYLLTTDKVETEIVAEASGTLRHAVPEGTTLAPGATAGWLLQDGEDAPDPAPRTRTPGPEPAVAGGNGAAAPVAGTKAPGRLKASPNARRVAAELGIDLRTVAGTGPGGRITSEDVEAAAAARPPAPVPAPADRRVLASPVAARLAERLGIDLGAVQGSGPGGRVTLDDVTAAAGRARAAPVVATAAAAPSGLSHAPGDRIPLRGMRGIIAQRMHQSLREMAQLTLGSEVRMDRAVALRDQLRVEWGDERPVPSLTDLVVKAVALALTRHPRLNATVVDEEIHLLEEVDVGLAVAVDDGLVVPVIRHADLLPLDTLAAESARLASAARAGRLGLDEMEGGTFSVTALGSAGIDFFTPVVNPPNVAILGAGRIRDGVAWDGDDPVRTQVMALSLTIDHRAIDGAPAAAFLRTVADLLESPLRLLATA